MKCYARLLLLILFAVSCGKESGPNIPPEDKLEAKFKPEKVLFIGNSHTQYNGGLNTLVLGFLENIELEYSPIAEQMTFGGYSLEDHLGNSNTLSKLSEKDWDIVVLQENTSIIVNDKAKTQAAFQDFSFKMPEAKTKLFMFMTWAYEDDPNGINDIQDTYEQIRPLVDGTIVPVGLAFKRIRQDPENTIDLYLEDGVHTTPEGSFLAAAMFYAHIYDLDPTLSTYNSTLDPGDATYLKEKAKEVMAAYTN